MEGNFFWAQTSLIYPILHPTNHQIENMRYDPQTTRAYYDALAEGETERWESSRFMMLQREVFRWHVDKRIGKGRQVLDAGCGAGVYTQQLVEIGAMVTAFDLSAVQLELCRRAAPGAAEYVQGSIVDLSRFESERFDAVLALGGSLSYCFEQAPTAVAELVRVLRPGGVFGCSVMSLAGACHNNLPGAFIDTDYSRRVFETGDLPRTGNRGHECHVFRLGELRKLLMGAGLREIEVSAPAYLSMVWGDEVFPEVGTEAWEFLRDAELDVGEECAAAGTHMLAWAVR